MHHCLRITEIQIEIFRSLSQNDCITLARVCRGFYEQAMDIVWAEVDTFVPFMMCMPLRIIHTRKNTHNPEDPTLLVSFSREPQPSDWGLFCKHTHRVKAFRTIGKTGFELYIPTTSALDQIFCFMSRHDCLFPRLEYLRVHTGMSSKYRVPAYLPYVGGGTLQSLDFVHGDNGRSPTEELARMVPSLCLAWPQLRSITLSLQTDVIGPCHLEGMASLLESLLCLQDFRTMFTLHPSLFYTLSHLPLLHTLDLNGGGFLPRNITFDSDLFQPSRPIFPSLKTLRILTGPYAIKSSVLVLQSLKHSSALTHVVIQLRLSRDISQTPSDMCSLFEAVSCLSLLEVLRIHMYNNDQNLTSSPQETEEVVFSGRLFSLLSSLHRLRNLDLYTDPKVTVEDQDLRNIAGAWPVLQEFRLNCGLSMATQHSDRLRITLVGIQALCSGCASLRKVRASVSDSIPTTDIPVSSTLGLPAADDNSIDSRIRQLELCLVPSYEASRSWNEGMAQLLATAIRFTFPSLDGFSAYLYHHSAFSDFSGLAMSWTESARTYWKSCSGMDQSRLRASLDELWAKQSRIADATGDHNDSIGINQVAHEH